MQELIFFFLVPQDVSLLGAVGQSHSLLQLLRINATNITRVNR